MSPEIISTNSYLDSLKQKYRGCEFPSYKFREWFSKTDATFFDCKDQDKASCLESILNLSDLEAFTVFIVAKESSGAFKLMDARFKNLGTETLKHFIIRFHQQLESMSRLSLQTAGLRYVECIGHSYVENSQSHALGS